MPAPTIPNFNALYPEPHKTVYGTPHAMYDGEAGTPVVCPDGWEVALRGPHEQDPSRMLLVIREKKAAPVPTPVPPVVTPTLPPLDWRKPKQNPREDGLVANGDTLLRNVCLDGFRQGIDHRKGRLDLINARIINSLRNNMEREENLGNACYSWPTAGPVYHEQSLFADNGWQEGRPLKWKNDRAHNHYGDVGAGHIVSVDSIYAAACFAGFQCRGDATLDRPIFLGNTIGVLAVGPGKVKIRGGVFYDCDVSDLGSAWDGGIGVAAWDEVELEACHFFARRKPWPPRGIAKCYPSAVQINKGHKKNPNGVGRIKASGCVIHSWPGDKPFGLSAPVPGFDVRNEPPVDYDWRPVIEKVKRNEISVLVAASMIRTALGI